MKVLFTGGSSFSGYWFIRELAAAGHEVVAAFHRQLDEYPDDIRRKGTLRGMHYQLAPKAETKIVRCIRGALYDMILDLRDGSATFGQSFGAELSAENRRMMYVPKGFAHGFLTLEDNTEAFYFVDEFYAPDHERCIRYNDPKFKLQWPEPPIVISDKDKNQSDFDPVWHLTI